MFNDGRSLRFLAGFGVLLMLLIVVIILIVHHGGGSSKVAQSQRQLMSYASDNSAVVTETIVGPISAIQTHDQLTINVSNQSTNVQISQGYDNNITSSKSYPMTQASFSEFLSALDRAGYTEGNPAASLKDDKGFCPTGQRYIYTVQDGSNTVERFWATSCGGTKSYKGNLDATINLFQNQVPDYDTFTDNTNFGGDLFGL